MTFPRVQQSVFAELEKIIQSMHIFIVISKNATTEVGCIFSLAREFYTEQVRMDARGLLQWDQREMVQHKLQVDASESHHSLHKTIPFLAGVLFTASDTDSSAQPARRVKERMEMRPSRSHGKMDGRHPKIVLQSSTGVSLEFRQSSFPVEGDDVPG